MVNRRTTSSKRLNPAFATMQAPNGIRSRIPQMMDEMCKSSISIQGGAHEKGTTKLALRC
jgi:hypothetical protein